MASGKAKGRKGKLGKNKHRIAAYYSSGNWHWNKARRIAHHLKRFAGDDTAMKALISLLAVMPLNKERMFKAQYEIST